MKSIIMPVHEQLDEKTKDQLFKEVKETVAKTHDLKKIRQRKHLPVQDMWKQAKTSKVCQCHDAQMEP
jgi:hypothetical protein